MAQDYGSTSRFKETVKGGAIGVFAGAVLGVVIGGALFAALPMGAAYLLGATAPTWLSGIFAFVGGVSGISWGATWGALGGAYKGHERGRDLQRKEAQMGKIMDLQQTTALAKLETAQAIKAQMIRDMAAQQAMQDQTMPVMMLAPTPQQIENVSTSLNGGSVPPPGAREAETRISTKDSAAEPFRSPPKEPSKSAVEQYLEKAKPATHTERVKIGREALADQTMPQMS